MATTIERRNAIVKDSFNVTSQGDTARITAGSSWNTTSGAAYLEPVFESSKKSISVKQYYAAACSYSVQNISQARVDFMGAQYEDVSLVPHNTYIANYRENWAFIQLSISHYTVKPYEADLYIYNENSLAFPPYCICELEDIKLVPRNLTPRSFFNVDNTVRFEWDYGPQKGEDGKYRTQKRAVIEWTSDNAKINTVTVNGADHLLTPIGA